MSLESGKYSIKSKSIEGGYIGRHFAEDRSLRPKKILLHFSPVPEWEFTKLDDGCYILKARGNHVAHIEGLVFAFLLPEQAATKWKIEARPQHGENVYTICEATGRIGWVCPEEDYAQVIARPLIVMPSYPPMFPPDELFEIVNVE